jgi:hypothetical protein
MPSGSRVTRGNGFFGKLKANVFTLGLSDRETQSQLAVVNLSAANILAMNGTPVTVVAAPGTGKAILVDSVIFKMVTTATAFASGGAVSIQYNGGSVVAHAGSIAAAVVTAGAGTSYTELGPAAATNGTTIVANKALEITNATGAFTTGTGTAVLLIQYRIVTLP